MRTLWVVEPSGPHEEKGWAARWKSPDAEWRWVGYTGLGTNVWHKKIYATRAEAVKYSALTCRNNFRYSGVLSELMVRRKSDGQWAKDKRTYGKDPEGNG